MNDLEFKLYQILEHPHKIVPAKRHRDWQKYNPYSFKCRPMANANCFGWDILCRDDIEVDWNGGTSMHDVTVTCDNNIAISNFGHGTITFRIGYALHTSKNWGMMICPIPNLINTIFTPYSALVETDELKYPIFITVKINTPGKYIIEKDTPICRLFPLMLEPVINCQPVLESEPEDFLKYRSWQATERKKFQDSDQFKMVKNTIPYQSEKLGWQKFYDKIAKFPIFSMKKL